MHGEGQLTFVVAGTPPAALAVAADRVRTIVPATAFAGPALRLNLPVPSASADADSRVLVLRRVGDDVGLRVNGELSMLTLEASAVLPLPEIVRSPSGLSHVLAPRGVPLVFVLDLARLDEAGTAGGASEARAAETET
jgi:hypothetical protein